MDTPVASVRIHRIEVLEVAPPEVTFDVECSAGTYIRALARDVGEDLGVGAHLAALRRLEIGAFHVDDALPAGMLGDRAALERALRPPLDAVAHLPWVRVGSEAGRRFALGQTVALVEEGAEAAESAETAGTAEGAEVAVVEDGRLLGVGSITEGALQPEKVLVATP